MAINTLRVGMYIQKYSVYIMHMNRSIIIGPYDIFSRFIGQFIDSYHKISDNSIHPLTPTKKQAIKIY